MKTAIATIVLAAMLATSVPVSASPQTGTSSDCLDFEVLFLVPGVESPEAAIVDVNPGSPFEITSSDGDAYVDFFDGDGWWVGWSVDDEVVPADASYGIVCVQGDLPLLSGGSYTYTEG